MVESLLCPSFVNEVQENIKNVQGTKIRTKKKN